MKILFVEDDCKIAHLLTETLQNNSYEVTHAVSVQEATEKFFSNNEYDVFILDVNLPDGNGYELCKMIRNYSKKAILFLTASNDEEQIVYGLECGADDYVVKPFRMQEFLSRVNALVRRQNYYNISKKMKSGDLILDLSNHVLYKNNEIVELKPIQFKIIQILMFTAPLIVTRDNLYKRLWENKNYFVEDNTLNVHLSYLRKALGSYNGRPYFITIYGVGYRWIESVEKNV